jgi:two-component sensor histidine kinase
MRTGAWLYLDEITHRVLNDYTAMLCTVRAASRKNSRSEYVQALEELTDRLSASATAFRALCPPSNQVPSDLDAQLEDLCASLSASILAKKAIRLVFVADQVHASAQQCWKICLIVSELVTNAARHAFNEQAQGSIIVEITKQEDAIRCAVVDDGVSLATIVPGRGSAILDAMVAELGGTIIRNHTMWGSVVVFRVPIEPG